MSRRVRVPLHGKPQGFATIDPEATEGAVIGLNLRWPDGTLVTVEELAGLQVHETTRVVGGNVNTQPAVTLWSVIQNIPPGIASLVGLPALGDKRVVFVDGDGFNTDAGFEYDKTNNALSANKLLIGDAVVGDLVQVFDFGVMVRDDDASFSFKAPEGTLHTHALRWRIGDDDAAEIEVDHLLQQFEIASTPGYLLQFRSGGTIAATISATTQEWDFAGNDLTTLGTVTASVLRGVNDEFKLTDTNVGLATGFALLGAADTVALEGLDDGRLLWNSQTVWHAGNDGAASGLDADLLDGQQGAYYLDRANHTGTQALATISDAGTAAAANIGTSGATVGLLDGNNTHSGVNTFAATVNLGDGSGDVVNQRASSYVVLDAAAAGHAIGGYFSWDTAINTRIAGIGALANSGVLTNLYIGRGASPWTGERGVVFTATATVFNETGLDHNLRVEGDTDANLIFVDASTDRVGMGTATPLGKLHVVGSEVNTGITTPAQWTANTDNYALPATARYLRPSTDAARNLTGMSGGTDGRRLTISNIGAQNLVLVHDATSTAANRFLCPGSVNFTLNANDSVDVWYDGSSARWRVVAF